MMSSRQSIPIRSKAETLRDATRHFIAGVGSTNLPQYTRDQDTKRYFLDLYDPILSTKEYSEIQLLKILKDGLEKLQKENSKDGLDAIVKLYLTNMLTYDDDIKELTYDSVMQSVNKNCSRLNGEAEKPTKKPRRSGESLKDLKKIVENYLENFSDLHEKESQMKTDLGRKLKEAQSKTDVLMILKEILDFEQSKAPSGNDKAGSLDQVVRTSGLAKVLGDEPSANFEDVSEFVESQLETEKSTSASLGDQSDEGYNFYLIGGASLGVLVIVLIIFVIFMKRRKRTQIVQQVPMVNVMNEKSPYLEKDHMIAPPPTYTTTD